MQIPVVFGQRIQVFRQKTIDIAHSNEAFMHSTKAFGHSIDDIGHSNEAFACPV